MKRKVIFSALVLIGSIVLLIVGYQKLIINNIECASQQGHCDEDINNLLSKYKGKGIIISYTGIRRELNNYPKVHHYSLQFVDLFNLKANITQRKPQVAVIAEGENIYHLYSYEGIKLDAKNETQLPIVRLKDSSITTEKQMKFVIEMAYALNQTYNVNTLVVQQGGIEFEVNRSPKIIFPIEGEIDVLLGSLTFVLSQLNSQLEDFRMEIVDFRFKNPIVKVIN